MLRPAFSRCLWRVWTVRKKASREQGKASLQVTTVHLSFQKLKLSIVTHVSKYKFYLAMENALCKDYITEKVFKVLSHNIIPVARGARKK